MKNLVASVSFFVLFGAGSICIAQTTQASTTLSVLQIDRQKASQEACVFELQLEVPELKTYVTSNQVHIVLQKKLWDKQGNLEEKGKNLIKKIGKIVAQHSKTQVLLQSNQIQQINIQILSELQSGLKRKFIGLAEGKSTEIIISFENKK